MARAQRILWLMVMVLVSLHLLSCSNDDDVPSISQEMITKSDLQGGWGVASTDVLWDLTTRGDILNKTYGFKSKVKDMVADKSAYVSIFFMGDTVFRIRHNPNIPSDTIPYVKQCIYTLCRGDSGNYMTFSDPDILGFYTSRMYIKHNSQGQLVFYMQKGEVVDMLKEDGSISSSYMSVIKSCINSAEVDIMLAHDDLPIYKEILSQYRGTAAVAN